MVNTKMACYATQIHPINLHSQGFLPHLFIIDPWFGFRCVFDLAVHTTISLTAASCSSCFILSLCSMAFWTFVHIFILAHFLATPETKSAGDFTVVIDLQKEVHANIIELKVESDSTDASAQSMLTDIGWAVSSDNANWTVIYQPPSTNMSNVRLVHNSRFQYPVGQVESFRYVRMTFKPVNPEERLKIKEINIWSHSPDGFYPNK
jgi:hypothetical protein